jgi:hypothetical protein
MRPHTYYADPNATDRPGGEPRCAACGLPLANATHKVPERTDEERELELRRIGETT